MKANHFRMASGELLPEHVEAMATLVLQAAGFVGTPGSNGIDLSGKMDVTRAGSNGLNAIVTAFQLAFGCRCDDGLEIDGVAGPKTLALLYQLTNA